MAHFKLLAVVALVVCYFALETAGEEGGAAEASGTGPGNKHKGSSVAGKKTPGKQGGGPTGSAGPGTNKSPKAGKGPGGQAGSGTQGGKQGEGKKSGSQAGKPETTSSQRR